MGNIYTTKEGIRKMEVEYGWGMDLEATEFPVSLALTGINLCNQVFFLDKKLEGKLNMPEVNMLYSYCNDVIENAKNGESTFVLDEFMGEQMEEMANIIKKLKQLKTK